MQVKVAVTARGPGLDAAVDSRFGRCAYFVITEPGDGKVEPIANNPGASGAGVEAVQLLARHGVEAVITGNLGPKAARALEVAGIPAYQFTGGTVQEALNDFKAGKLSPISSTVDAHFALDKGKGEF